MSITELQISPALFLKDIIIPALKAIAKDSIVAEQLLLGTAIQESHLKYLRQLNNGPALGYFQMEPKTHDDIWKNFLDYRPTLAAKILSLGGISDASSNLLTTNHKYAAAMARIQYLRAPKPLPTSGDINAIAQYWKQFYNTGGGKGTTDEFVINWQKANASSLF